jgi:hypothetical protein
MGIYLNKWSGELQLEIKEGCVHGTYIFQLKWLLELKK